MAWADSTWQNGQAQSSAYPQQVAYPQSAAYPNSYGQGAWAQGDGWAQGDAANWHQGNAASWNQAAAWQGSWTNAGIRPEHDSSNGSYAESAGKVGAGYEAPHVSQESRSNMSRENYDVAATSKGKDLRVNVTGGPDGKMGTTLRGSYSYFGENHNRPQFQKLEQTDSGPSQVLIYFWDDRDGANMSGWWFGPEAGGDQVWAFHSDKSSSTPPSAGWRVPFDGPVDPSLCVSTINGDAHTEEDPLASLAKRIKIETPHAHQTHPELAAPSGNNADARQDPSSNTKQQEVIDEIKKQRQAEELATWMVRSAIKKLSTATTADDLDACSTALEKAQADNWASLGGGMQKELADEIASVRQQAQQRARRLEDERMEEEKLELEKVLLNQAEQRRLREERERLEAVIKTAEEHAGKAESEADAAHSKAGELLNAGVPPPLARIALEAGEAAEKMRLTATTAIVQVLSDIDGTVEALQVAAKDAQGAHSRSNYAEAKAKLAKLQEKMRVKRASLNTLACSLAEAIETTRRRDLAERYEEELYKSFKRYDRDEDERLSNDEVRALALGEYDLELPDAFLERVQRILVRKDVGVPYDRFRRLQQMIGIELMEVRKRKQILEEEERRRCMMEEAKQKRRDIAERKLKAQSLLDDASEFLEDVAKELPRVEEVGRPLLAEERLNSTALRGVCESTESALQPFDVAVSGAKAKLDEAHETIGEDLGNLLKPELFRLRGRLDDAEKRVDPLRVAIATARERASKKEVEEEKAQTRKKALSKLEQRYEELDEGGSSDEFDF